MLVHRWHLSDDVETSQNISTRVSKLQQAEILSTVPYQVIADVQEELRNLSEEGMLVRIESPVRNRTPLEQRIFSSSRIKGKNIMECGQLKVLWRLSGVSQCLLVNMMLMTFYRSRVLRISTSSSAYSIVFRIIAEGNPSTWKF